MSLRNGFGENSDSDYKVHLRSLYVIPGEVDETRDLIGEEYFYWIPAFAGMTIFMPMVPNEKGDMTKDKANKIYKILEKAYPEATCALVHKNTAQLLVATILSAQCTDKRVNIVTKDLFKKYKNVKEFASAEQAVFEQEIRSTGFYKNKAKNIIASARLIEKDFNGKVPNEMEDLLELPGVARKTANIVLFHAYGKNEGVAVDTHVKRLSVRLGMSKEKDPVKIERELMKLFERNIWGVLTDVLIQHGRKICDARKPLCGECPVRELCPSAEVK